MTIRNFIEGPPGSGKSSVLVDLIAMAMERLGPDRVAVVSFTRTAGAELQERLAERFGIKDRSQRNLRNHFKKVGTIHSVGYRTLGLSQKNMAIERFNEFTSYVKIAPLKGKYDKNPEFSTNYWWVSEGGASTEADAMLQCVASARHQEISVEEAFDQLPVAKQLQTSSSRIASLARQYDLWRREAQVHDYEDILVESAKIDLGVKALFLDEAQDCSKLQWRTVNAWAEHSDFFTAAGDGYQAIFKFQGGSPEMFLSQPGAWRTLPVSHRLDQAGVEHCRSVLWKGGYPGVLADWRGEGGEARDGTTFYLGRTHLLVSQWESQLQQQGTPYLGLSGWSPYTSKAADAYRALRDVETAGSLSADRMKKVVETLPAGLLPRGAKVWADRARGDADWPREWPTPQTCAERLQYYHYFRRIEKQHGERGMYMTPTVFTGTGHAAKGREADRAFVASSWAFRPAREQAASIEGMKSEALVAYVMTSRARLGTTIVEGFQGDRYPW